jgi:hypothetical protein
MLRLLASALAIVALVAAGCGGSDDGGKTSTQTKAEYTKQIEQARDALSKAFTDIGAGIGKGASAKQIGDRLDEGSKALDDAASRIGNVTPPSDVKDAQASLVAGLRELGDVFAKSADAARKGDTAELAKSLQNVQASEGSQKISEAIAEMKKKGYPLPTG